MHARGFLAGLSVGLLAALALPATCAAQKKEKLTAEQVVERHLASIGAAPARTAAKTRILEGQANFRMVTQGVGQLAGPLYFASEGVKMRCAMRFGHPKYTVEEFAYNGEKIDVGQMEPGKRSPLENALLNYNELTREGLFGGSLSTAWTFLHWPGKEAKLSYDGTKKVDGRETYAIRYQPKRGSGTTQITLYFDAETFRHVRTTYKITMPRSLGATPDASPRVREPRFTIDETFTGHQAIEGLVLPTEWTVQYSYDGPEGSIIMEWKAWVERVTTNDRIDPKIFVLE